MFSEMHYFDLLSSLSHPSTPMHSEILQEKILLFATPSTPNFKRCVKFDPIKSYMTSVMSVIKSYMTCFLKMKSIYLYLI